MECFVSPGNFNPSRELELNESIANDKQFQIPQQANPGETLHQRFYGLWVALLIINSFIFLMGIILNSLALYVFCFQTKVRTPSVIYTINLVVTDLLVGLSLPARIVMYYRNVETCHICYYVHSFTYSVNMYCSILFLTCICVDRYLAIVQAKASRRWRNPSYAKCICVLIWIFAVIVTFIILTTTINHKRCFFQLLMLTGFEYFVPLVIVVFYTLRIMWTLSKSIQMNQSRERRVKAVQLLIMVLVIFTVCFTPIHVSQVVFCVRSEVSRDVILIVYHVTVTLSSFNSCMDPIVYCFVTSHFQSARNSIFGEQPSPVPFPAPAVGSSPWGLGKYRSNDAIKR